MAARLNTKLILILAGAVTVTAMTVGALYYLNIRNNAERSVRRGDEAYAAGQLEKAINYYVAAVFRAPTNYEYVNKLERTLREFRPANEAKAAEKYRELLGVLAHKARYNPTDADAHFSFLRELHNVARQRSLDQHAWDTLAETAEDTLRQMPESNAQRILAQTYRVMGTIYRNRSVDEVNDAIEDLDEVLREHPNDDLTWAMLIKAQLAIAEKLRTTGSSPDMVNEQFAKVDDTIRRALEAVPDGPEVAHAHLRRLLAKQSAAPESVSASELRAAADRLESLASVTLSSGFISEAADTLSGVPEDGLDRALRVLERYLEVHPEAHEKRLGVALVNFLADRSDEAEKAARMVIDAEPLPTSYLAQVQSELRRRGASLLVDIANKRYEQADAAEKPKHLEAMEAARQELYTLVSDKSNDPLLLRADGLLAFAKADYAKATAIFERLVRESNSNDPELLACSAHCLINVNQLGLAHERLSRAVELSPRTYAWVIQKASLELSMGRDADAIATLNSLPAHERDNDQVRSLQAAIHMRAQGQDVPPDDPIAAAIAAAADAQRQGDHEAARSNLLAALATSPDHPRLLRALVQVEMQAGQRDKAREYLDRAMALAPDDAILRQLDASLRYEDPIQAVREYCKAAYPNEKDRMAVMLMTFAATSQQQEIIARQLEQRDKPDSENIAKARDLAARAAAEAETVANELEQVDPRNMYLLEFRFVTAITSNDWVAAEKVVATVKAHNLDQTNGLYYQGRLETARGQHEAGRGRSEAARQHYLAAAQALEAATDHVNFMVHIWRDLGAVYRNLGNLAQAQSAYEQAYRCNPNDMGVIRSLLDVLVTRGEKVRALRIARDAHALVPNDWAIRDRWLQLEAEAGDKALALTERRATYKDDPKNWRNAVALAELLGKLEPSRESIINAQGQPIYSDQHWTHMSVPERNQVIERIRVEWSKEADAILHTLADVEQDDPTFALRLATMRAWLLRLRGEVSAGESLLREFIAKQPADEVTADMYIALAQYQAQRNHFAEAIATFQQAIAIQDPKQRQADLALGRLYLDAGAFDKALEHLTRVAETAPDGNLEKQIIECLVRLKRLDDAERRLAEAREEAPSDAMLIMLAATLAEARGDELLASGQDDAADRKYAEHRELLAKAEAEDPLSPMPRVLLAQSLWKEYRRTQRSSLLDDALRALDRADQIREGTAEASRLRVAILREKRELPAAIAEQQRLVKRDPTDVAARRDLTQLHLENRDVDSAMAVVDEAIRLNPTMAAWHELKGDLQRVYKQDAAASVPSFAKAYELSKSSMALLKLVDAMLSVKPENCRGVIDRLANQDEAMAEQPLLREYYARALHCVGRRDEALDHARRAHVRRGELIAAGRARPEDVTEWYRLMPHLFGTQSAAGQSIDVLAAEKFVMEVCDQNPGIHDLRALARLWVSSPQKSRAIELQRQAISQCPADQKDLLAALQADLATFILMSGDHAAAAEAYEKALQLNPDHVESLNNLAYIIADQLHDPAKAMPYVERVLKLAPEDPFVLDTAGWVYFLSGDVDRAKQYLRQSLERRQIATTHMHLAEALLKAGDIESAQYHLGEAGKLKPDASTQQDIKRLADDIRNSRTSSR